MTGKEKKKYYITNPELFYASKTVQTSGLLARIFSALILQGPLSEPEICRQTDLAPDTVKKHGIPKLEKLGIVKKVKKGNERLYEISVVGLGES